MKLDRLLTLDEACHTAHADNYDFSNKLLQQGDCVHIVHEDAQNNCTTSCIAYVLRKHEAYTNVELGMESQKEMFECVIFAPRVHSERPPTLDGSARNFSDQSGLPCAQVHDTGQSHGDLAATSSRC